MEQNKPKAGLRPNLFDAIVLLLALAAAAVLIWVATRPAAEAYTTEMDSLLRFTVRMQRWPEGSSQLVRVGDVVADNSRGLPLGKVVDIQVVPAEMRTLDMEAHRYVQAKVEGFEDVLITIEGYGTVAPDTIRAYGRMILTVGNTGYIRGPGYMGSGPIVSLEDTPLEPHVFVSQAEVRGDGTK